MERIPISEKYSLTIQEASEYFSIGVKKMRRLAEENVGRFSVFSGNRYLIRILLLRANNFDRSTVLTCPVAPVIRYILFINIMTDSSNAYKVQ